MITPALIKAGWTLSSHRIRSHKSTCDHCSVDTYGLTVLSHPTHGTVCSQGCAEAATADATLAIADAEYTYPKFCSHCQRVTSWKNSYHSKIPSTKGWYCVQCATQEKS